MPFTAELHLAAPLTLRLTNGAGDPKDYRLAAPSHSGWLDLFAALADDFGLRRPAAREAPAYGQDAGGLRPVLTEPIGPGLAYGYGDPCVVRVGPDEYRLLVTSNDAPDAFPMLASNDLERWSFKGFVFPAGAAPGWALTGAEVSDFWAPELHKVGEEWWVCFTAREHDRSLAIGLARSRSPDGPFEPDPGPLVRGGVIDSHILIDDEGAPWLIWKRDDNDRWPRELLALLHAQPRLIAELFEGPDLGTASLAVTLWPWIQGLEPMQQFFLLQTLIEAVGEDLDGFSARLQASMGRLDAREASQARQVLAALRTKVFAQRLSPDGTSLEGEPAEILQNDRLWEGHLIEGVWITREAGRYYLLYAGNDFSTGRYGIGAAVAEHPDGPYRKRSEVLLRSSPSWWGPGHPSVVMGPDGRRRMFLHGFSPGVAGYKAFRSLLTVPIKFSDGEISLPSEGGQAPAAPTQP